MVITMAKLRMAHASTHGARKPPGPKKKKERLNNGDNNGQATHGARKPPGPKTHVLLVNPIQFLQFKSFYFFLSNLHFIKQVVSVYLKPSICLNVKACLWLQVVCFVVACWVKLPTKIIFGSLTLTLNLFKLANSFNILLENCVSQDQLKGLALAQT